MTVETISAGSSQLFSSNASEKRSAEVFSRKEAERLPIPGGSSDSDDAAKISISKTTPAELLSKEDQ